MSQGQPILKPCPFCGESPKVVGTDVQCPTHGCFTCEGTGFFYESEQDAIWAWNTRKQLPQIKPLVWVDSEYTDGWQNAESPLCFCSVAYVKDEWGSKKDYRADVYQSTEWFDTEAEAKAWCQSEYERRVRECLE